FGEQLIKFDDEARQREPKILSIFPLEHPRAKIMDRIADLLSLLKIELVQFLLHFEARFLDPPGVDGEYVDDCAQNERNPQTNAPFARRNGVHVPLPDFAALP
ncbi:MAG TPA: hypothetical protein PLV61_14035, partial [Parvularculaceae bacterium]|nr:hypothetical protein [Parvularculaceae bacterium]